MNPNHITKETRATGSFDLRDSLTGVRGYYTLLNDVEQFEGDDVYVALCDIDNFRMINDAYGENVGNTLLSRIGQELQANFGDDHTFRYGSDEFLIVNSFFDEDAFLEKVDFLMRKIARIDYKERPLHMTLSVGFVHGTVRSIEEMHEAIRFADRKMYEAKRLGKARAVGALLAADPRLVGGVHIHEHNYKSYEIDELTGLANLVYFRNLIDDVLNGKGGPAFPATRKVALVYFNIENFKAFNQHFGFDEGDTLLLQVAKSILGAFPGDVAARFSADQFMVATDADTAEAGIKEVRTAFRKRHKDSSIWLRAGYYVIEEGDSDPGLACDRAKAACDSVKGRRDAFYRRYDDELKRAIRWRRYVLDHFDEAVRNDWIQPYYQPIVRTATGEICDIEALARWIDPVEGVISPADFIPALEDARLIHRLDLKVLDSVCRECDKLRRMGREFTPPSINLSRLDFELCDIVAEVEAVLEKHDIPRSLISVEVTESALTGNRDFLKSEVDRFREEGFEVWMDDFGSGYSSLNTLKEYTFDLVKIDMAFLRGFEEIEESRIMLAHIVNLAKELHLQTLVEGVETREQLEFLRSIGVGRAQGYFIGRPLPLSQSIEDSKAGKLPPSEPSGKRDFFNEIGRINLVRPNPHDPVDEHYLPSDVAACIICKQEGRYEYLNVNVLYAQFLRDVGIGTTDDSEVVINDPSNPRRKNFVDVLERCAVSHDWEHYVVDVAGVPLDVQMRMFAEAEEYDAAAFLSIVKPKTVTD